VEKALTLYQTSIGKKAVMALSGVVLVGYAAGHMLGNLQLYAGPEVINAYAASLRRLPLILWGTRVLLLVAFAAHIASSFSLWRTNQAARTTRYQQQKDVATNYAARTMYWSGPILLLYVVYHLAHLTFGKAPHSFDHHNVYNNLVYGFQVWWVSAIYVFGNLALGFHLFHGAWSFFQSLGLNHPRYNAWRKQFAIAVALVITLGNLSFPFSVLAGWVKPTTKTFYFPELD